MENNLKNIELKKLTSDHSSDLYNLLSMSREAYYKYFTPFSIDPDIIKSFLSAARKDQYIGFFINETLIGFYMLRGLDAGFEVPSYGVFIAEKYQSIGLAKLSVNHALSFCKLNKINELMLKVHPKNEIALNIYKKFDFKESGYDPQNENLILKRNIF